jgi:hypothetical protein
MGLNQVELVYASYATCGTNPTSELEHRLTNDLRESLSLFHGETGR